MSLKDLIRHHPIFVKAVPIAPKCFGVFRADGPNVTMPGKAQL